MVGGVELALEIKLELDGSLGTAGLTAALVPLVGVAGGLALVVVKDVVRDLVLAEGVAGRLMLVEGVAGGLVLMEGVAGGLVLAECVVCGLVLVEGVAFGLVLVEGVAGELVLVEGGVGTAEDASLTAHSRPSFGGQRVDGFEWARLATKLTRARLLRLLK